MPKVVSVFRVQLPIKAVWSFMSDRREVGCLFPGCLGVTILDDVDSIWKIRVTFGPFSKTVEMKTHTTVYKEQEQLSWVGQGDHIRMSGDVFVKKIADDITEVTYDMEGHVSGPFSTLQEIVVHEKLKEVKKKFIRNIKNELGWELDES
ncbi:MAG: SRPBCC domain-containing protein [Nitrospiraceae bacterium]|nr:SRPBCC domain-containing protein [Nitrospiraceae bacterium]